MRRSYVIRVTDDDPDAAMVAAGLVIYHTPGSFYILCPRGVNNTREWAFEAAEALRELGVQAEAVPYEGRLLCDDPSH